MDTRTFHLGGGPPGYPEVGRWESTFPSEGSCVMAMHRVPNSKDCFAMPREASRPAKLPYIPPERLQSPKNSNTCALVYKTRTLRDVKHDVVYREQNLSTVLAVERRERLWSVRLKRDGRRMICEALDNLTVWLIT